MQKNHTFSKTYELIIKNEEIRIIFLFTFPLKIILFFKINYKFMKYKKTWVTLLVIFSFYLFVFFQASKVQTLSTFPWIKANLQDVVWYNKTNLSFEEINLKSKSWENINGLYLTWTKNEIVYYFHWNWGSLPYFYSEIKYINNLWYWVFAYDYPWYGKSTWFPDKKLVSEFSQNFFEYIKKEKNIKSENLLIWGYSVGTAVATDFASKNDFSKIILVSPFSSRYDMGKRWFFGIPLQKILFLENSYKTSELVQKFKKPALIIHGNQDMIVPFWQWKKVFENYAWEKYFIEIDWFWHNWIIDTFWQAFKWIFSDFILWNKLDFKELFIDEKKKNELELDVKKQEIEKAFLSQDFVTDDSITKYVSDKISFEKLDYKPDDLVYLSWSYIFDAKWNQTLRKEVLEKLDELSKDFYEKFQVKLKIVSAYRSYQYQVWIKSGWCSDLFCAKPWFSEHQSGLAFDMFETTSNNEFLSKPDLKKYFDWMSQNAYKYWFNNSYQKWPEIDWYAIEPWHWRYVWVDFAKYLWEKNMTFWEFYNNLK